MTEQKDRQLENLLRQRHEPQPPGGLAERIIDRARTGGAAAARKARRPWWAELGEWFVLPKPALAFAFTACLVLGVFLGGEASGYYVSTQESWGYFLTMDEDGL